MKKLLLYLFLLSICTYNVCNASVVYNAKINLTTTKEIQLPSTFENYNIMLGVNDDNIPWYNDEIIVQNAFDEKYGDVGEYKKVIEFECGFKISQGYMSEKFKYGLVAEDKLEVMKLLGYDPISKTIQYDNKTDENEWLEEVNVSIVKKGICYRTLSHEEIVGYIVEKDNADFYWTQDKNFSNLKYQNYNHFI